MNKVRYGQCPSCHATGVYRGAIEPMGVGVVCTQCNGSGKVQSVSLPLFLALQRRDEITTVFSSISDKHGVYIGKGIDYGDFFKGLMPDQEGTTTVVI